MGNLFDIEEQEPDWKQEWKDMPEFIQDKKEPYAKIIGQKLTKKTKSIWHPFKSHWGGIKKVWTNEK